MTSSIICTSMSHFGALQWSPNQRETMNCEKTPANYPV